MLGEGRGGAGRTYVLHIIVVRPLSTRSREGGALEGEGGYPC